MADYIRNLRRKIGHEAILSPVVGAIILQNHKILLQKRADNGLWAIHGGAIECGETYIDAIKRELQEEIGIIPIDLELYGIYSGKNFYHVYPNDDEVYMINHVFICTNYIGEENPDLDEVLELEWFDIDCLPSELMKIDKLILEDLPYFLESKKVIVK
ncbi:MAG: NUDIX domain-containing protein [Clostridia bacterium]|nr:NUDIX domain-containing protein [Clostridia bacterium]